MENYRHMLAMIQKLQGLKSETVGQILCVGTFLQIQSQMTFGGRSLLYRCYQYILQLQSCMAPDCFFVSVCCALPMQMKKKFCYVKLTVPLKYYFTNPWCTLGTN